MDDDRVGITIEIQLKEWEVVKALDSNLSLQSPKIAFLITFFSFSVLQAGLELKENLAGGAPWPYPYPYTYDPAFAAAYPFNG